MEVRGPSLDALATCWRRQRKAWPDRSVERLRSATRGVAEPEQGRACRCAADLAQRVELPDPVPTRRRSTSLVPSLDAWWRKHRRRLIDVPLVDLDDRGLDAYADAYDDLVDLPAGVNNIGRRPVARRRPRRRSCCGCSGSRRRAHGMWRSPRQVDAARSETATPTISRKARDWAREITAEATTRGIDKMSRRTSADRQSSLVRIYDEWCYLAFTRGVSRVWRWMSRICACSSTTTSDGSAASRRSTRWRRRWDVTDAEVTDRDPRARAATARRARRCRRDRDGASVRIDQPRVLGDGTQHVVVGWVLLGLVRAPPSRSPTSPTCWWRRSAPVAANRRRGS